MKSEIARDTSPTNIAYFSRPRRAHSERSSGIEGRPDNLLQLVGMKLGGESAYWRIGWVVYWFVEMSVSGSKIRGTMDTHQEPMTSLIHRQMRQLSYPDDSEMGLFFALAVPLDDPVSTKAVSVAFFFEANYQLTTEESDTETGKDELRDEESANRSRRKRRRPIDRRTIYSMIESKFQSFGFPGKSCLLRSICETVLLRTSSLHAHNGLIGDLMRIIFTPSSSLDESLPDDYTDAENRATNASSSDDCRTTYPLCPFGIYDYITAA